MARLDSYITHIIREHRTLEASLLAKGLLSLMGLVGLASFGCQTRPSESSLANVSDSDKAAIVSIFERSCATCHAQWYRDPGAGSAVTWDLIARDARRIAKVTSRSGTGVQMPPATAPQSASIADSDAAFIHDALLQLAPPEPVFNPTSLPLDKLTLPPGFTVSVFAVVTGARSLAMAPDGTVFVGTGGFSDVDPDGRVTAIRDVNGDGKIDATGESWVIARSLDNPNGVAFLDGDLYVAEEFELIRFPDILNHLSAPPSPVSVSRDFPTNPQHSWKYLGVGPDKKLYVPVGSPCNICNPEAGTSAGKFSRIFRLNFNAQRTQVVSKDVVAKGVRNTVGFDWDPTTNELWFTDNGRDNIEDDLTPDARRRLISELGIVIPPGEILNNLIPPDELNHVVQEGSDFGFPRCFGKKIKDPRFGTNFDCSGSSQVVPSQVDLQGHAAALGMKFYTGGMFPDQFKNQAFIAEHGSWNSTPGYPKGYKVSLVRFDPTDHSPISYEPFLSGFAYLDGHDEVVWGRPVDILVQADGAILVSDDHAGVIYRIAYSGQ